jgi:hypothetical protein
VLRLLFSGGANGVKITVIGTEVDGADRWRRVYRPNHAGGKFPFQRTVRIYRVEVSVIAGANVDGSISANRW